MSEFLRSRPRKENKVTFASEHSDFRPRSNNSYHDRKRFDESYNSSRDMKFSKRFRSRGSSESDSEESSSRENRTNSTKDRKQRDESDRRSKETSDKSSKRAHSTDDNENIEIPSEDDRENDSFEYFTGDPFTEAELADAAFISKQTKNFNGSKITVENLPKDVKKSDLYKMFQSYGEIFDLKVSKCAATMIFDTKARVEDAIVHFNDKMFRSQRISVRLNDKRHIIVKQLSPNISNEVLFLTFSHFGNVMCAIHLVDENGKPSGTGLVEFENETSAMNSVKITKDKVFLMNSSSHPIQIELGKLDLKNNIGVPECNLEKTPEFIDERQLGPRFAEPDSFEYDYGQRWKVLYESERKQRDELEKQKINLEKSLQEARESLEIDAQNAYDDFKLQLLHDDLRMRQEEIERLEAARNKRMLLVKSKTTSNNTTSTNANSSEQGNDVTQSHRPNLLNLSSGSNDGKTKEIDKYVQAFKEKLEKIPHNVTKPPVNLPKEPSPENTLTNGNSKGDPGMTLSQAKIKIALNAKKLLNVGNGVSSNTNPGVSSNTNPPAVSPCPTVDIPLPTSQSGSDNLVQPQLTMKGRS